VATNTVPLEECSGWRWKLIRVHHQCGGQETNEKRERGLHDLMHSDAFSRASAHGLSRDGLPEQKAPTKGHVLGNPFP